MYKTEQEKFWAGTFGNEYINRNYDSQMVASSLNMFGKIFSKTNGVESVIEYGPNIGVNIKAIKELLPKASIAGVEINEKAASFLTEVGGIDVYNESILTFTTNRKYDFVFTRGVLIHINPESLPDVYESMYNASSKYIMVAEYYNPSPVSIPYRGEIDKLFKRDFAGDLMEKYPDLKLVDYGFEYKRDCNFPQDDITWFLLEKGVK